MIEHAQTCGGSRARVNNDALALQTMKDRGARRWREPHLEDRIGPARDGPLSHAEIHHDPAIAHERKRGHDGYRMSAERTAARSEANVSSRSWIRRRVGDLGTT